MGGGACMVGGMHGRGACVVGGHVWWGCAWWGVCMVGACMAGEPSMVGGHARQGAACMAGGACVAGWVCAWQILRDTVNERAVPILLECILVYICGGLALGVEQCE